MTLATAITPREANNSILVFVLTAKVNNAIVDIIAARINPMTEITFTCSPRCFDLHSQTCAKHSKLNGIWNRKSSTMLLFISSAVNGSFVVGRKESEI